MTPTITPTVKKSIFDLSPEVQHTIEMVISIMVAGALSSLYNFLLKNPLEFGVVTGVVAYFLKIVLQALPFGV